MNRIDFSFDLETLGTKADAHILSIGCAAFDIETGKIIDELYIKIEPIKQHNREIDINTVNWWLTQSQDARESITKTSERRYNLELALLEVTVFISKVLRKYDLPDEFVWGNGSTFDISILEHAYRNNYSYAGKEPWSFRNVRDMRTIVDIAKMISSFDYKSIEREGTHHNALDDAIHQAKIISAAFESLNLKDSNLDSLDEYLRNNRNVCLASCDIGETT